MSMNTKTIIRKNLTDNTVMEENSFEGVILAYPTPSSTGAID